MFEELTERHHMSTFLKLDMGPMCQIPLPSEQKLYLGNIPNAEELQSTNGEKWCILNCTDDPALDYLKHKENFDCIRLNHLDGEPYPQASIANGIGYINNSLKDGAKVLVCCHAGVSRSAGMTLAYLIARLKYDEKCYDSAGIQEIYNRALSTIRKARPFIQIHPKIDLSIRQYFRLAPKSPKDLISKGY